MNRRDKARSRVREMSTQRNQIEIPEPLMNQDMQPSGSLPTGYKEADNIEDAKAMLSQTTVANSLAAIDDFIGKTYLNSVDSYPVVPLKKTIKKNNKSVEVFDIPGEPENLPSFRWFQIDKIVYEKGVFFSDKFSMLFSSLHAETAQVVLILEKNEGIVKMFLGTRDNNDNAYNLSGETLEAAMNGFLTGVHLKRVDCSEVSNLTEQYKSKAVACVSGIASLRDEKKETFVQGLERLINSTTSIPSYTAYFIADSVTEEERISIVNAYQRIYRQLSPLEEFQATLSMSKTDGITDTITNGITNTVGRTIGRTITNGTTYTTTKTETNGQSSTDTNSSGWGYSENSGGSATFTPLGIGVSGNWGETESYNEGTSHSDTILKQLSEAVSEGNMHQISDLTQQLVQDSKMKQDSHAKSASTTKSQTLQLTTKDLHVKDVQNTIELQIKRLRNAAPFGLWNCATYFVSTNNSTSRKIANIYKGTIVGEESGLEISCINSWDELNPSTPEITKYLSCGLNPRFLIGNKRITPCVTVSSKELAIHMALPQSSVPGIVVQTRASFGRTISRYTDAEDYEDEEFNGNCINEDNIVLGNVLHLGREEKKNKVYLDINNITRHIFVTGSTGSGKSNIMYLLLKSLKDVGKTFLVIEPTKGEYKRVLGGLKNVSVYGANPYETKVLTINPFWFDFKKGILLCDHVDHLVDIFNSCWPMSAAMPEVLKKSILDSYKACGWNIRLSRPFDLNNVSFPTFADVINSLRDFIDSSDYSAETQSDYKGAIETRLVDLTEGTSRMIFNSIRFIPDEELFDKNVIIDLHTIGNSQTVSLIMGILILKLNEYRVACGGMDEDLKHVTVLEEAHNILKRTSTVQAMDSSNLTGKSVEMIADGMSKMRTYGEGFIIVDQSPAHVDMSAIRHTNTKIILSLPDEEDRETVGKSIGLSDDQIVEISRQKMGQAIVYQNDWEEPVQCAVTKFKGFASYIPEEDLDTLNDSDEFHPNAEILKFLVAGRLNARPHFDIQKVLDTLRQSRILSSVKYRIGSMISEYNRTGTCIIWQDDKFKDLSKLVSSYIDKNKEVHKIMLNCKGDNPEILSKMMCELLPEELQQLSSLEKLTIIQSLMRFQATSSSDMLTIYANWKSNTK